MDIKVEHERDKAFYAFVYGKKCILEYDKLKDNILDLKGTFVPPSLRHRGIASKIALTALEYAKEHGYRVKPTCNFVEDYIKKHDEYKDLVAKTDLVTN